MPARRHLAANPRRRIVRAPIAALSLLALSSLVPPAGAQAPLAVSLLPAALPLRDGSGEVALLVVIEVATGGASAALAHGEIRLSLRDAQGEQRGSIEQPLDLSPETDASRGIRLYAEFRLPPGSYALEATAKNAETGATGSAAAEVRLPKSGTEAWLASPALILDPRAGWLVSRADQAAESRLPFAFVAPTGGAYLPAASIEVAATERIVAQALVAAPSSDFPFVVAEVTPARGGAPRPIPAAVTRIAPSPYPGVFAVTLELGPLRELGDYRLRLGFAATDGRLESPIGSTLAVRATPAGAAAAVSALPALPPNADVASRYRRILASLPSAGVDVTAPELARFELAAIASAAGNDRPRAIVRLREAERAAITALERSAGRSADPARLAIAALDLAAAALFRDQGESGMAAGSSQRAAELLSEVARGAEPELRARAVDLLALANPAQALTFDPNHALALLRTAIVEERARRYADASQTLARLLRAQPDNAEARLRSAVILRRSGKVEAARDELARLVAAPVLAPWILELAYSELAANEQRLGHPQEAERWLRQGIERVEAQSLHLQLGYYLDRSNRRSAATAAVNALPLVSVDAPYSARLLYSLAPVEESAAVRARTRVAVAAALPELGRALAGDGGQGSGR